MLRAVVTGATGFLGNHLINHLVSNEYHVTAIIRNNSSRADTLSRFNSIDILEVDLNSNYDIEKKLCGRYDYFFHLAWEGVSGVLQEDTSVQLKNIEMAIMSVSLAKKLGCKRYIACGSIHETEGLKELGGNSDVVNKANTYKIAKLAAHHFCKLKASELNIEFVWPILTNAYGEGENSNRLIQYSIKKLLNNEIPEYSKADQLYNFIYITDVAKAFRLIAEKGKSFENYIIGSPEVRQLKSYLEELKEFVNPEVDLVYGKNSTKAIYLEEKDLYNSNLADDTGFYPEISFQIGLEKTINWMKSVME